MAYKLNSLWFWHVTLNKKKSKALFFDKVWGPRIEKSTRHRGGWINTIEIVFIRLIRKVHSLKTIMADVIMTAFNFLQRHVLSAHRYLAVCGALHKVRQTWSLFTEAHTIVHCLCWEHNFLLVAVVWKTLLVIICAVWVFFIFEGSFLLLSCLLITLYKVVFYPLGMLLAGCMWGEYSYRVGGVSLQNVLFTLSGCFVPVWSLESLMLSLSQSHLPAPTAQLPPHQRWQFADCQCKILQWHRRPPALLMGKAIIYPCPR